MPGENPPADGKPGDPPKQGEGTPPEAPKPVTFASQAEVDQMVEARVARERAKFADYDTLKAKAEAFDKAEDAKKDELQRAQEAKAAAEKAAAEATANTNAVLKKAAIMVEAAKQGADPDLTVLMLMGDESIVVNGAEVTGTEAAVKKALADKPGLKIATASPPKSGGQFNGAETKTLDDKIAEAEKAGDTQLAIRLKIERYKAAQQQ